MTINKHAKTGRIRTFLRDKKEGMSAQLIADTLGLDADYVRVMLTQMPDTYIERWDRTKTGRGWLAVWNVAHVPPDAMRPKSAAVERRLYDAQYRERKRYAKRKAEMAEKNAASQDIAPTDNKPKTVWVTPPPWSH
jgi:hypothetical protein